MKSWTEYVFFIVLGLSILAIPIMGWAILDTQVSIKYELDKPSDCVSQVTSIDLCSRVQTLESLVVICILTIVVLLIFRKWFFVA
jgi:uncharacterized membrane protein